MNPILRYECGGCGTIHSSRKEAEGCCPTPIDTVYQCSECDSNSYDAVWAEACCTRTKMNNSDRDPDAIDRIRDDALTEQKWKWPVAPDGMSATVNARLQEQAARIAELEAQLAAATERERVLARIVADLQYEMNPLNARVECIRCGVDYTETHHVDCDIQNALAASEKGRV